jgi:hypothetical protein
VIIELLLDVLGDDRFCAELWTSLITDLAEADYANLMTTSSTSKVTKMELGWCSQ